MGQIKTVCRDRIIKRIRLRYDTDFESNRKKIKITDSSVKALMEKEDVTHDQIGNTSRDEACKKDQEEC
jgi:hypothetical protein